MRLSVRWLKKLMVLFAGLTFLLGAVAQATPTQDSVQNRLGNVKRLIEVSSAAQQIETGGNPDALAMRQKARELHQQAEARYNEGNYVEADRLLSEASKLMFEAVRISGRPDAIREKQRKDYESFGESVNALLQALERVAAEKGRGAKAIEVRKFADGVIAEARKLAEAGNYEAARQKLDEAYQLIKSTINELRGGDTLVKPIKFGSKAEEYRYELDRNQTHEMLFQMLCADKLREGDLQARIAEAQAARAEAEKLAEAQDWDGAIRRLDNSTRDLVREIRRAGVYIPD